jgi:hypothetical protein
MKTARRFFTVLGFGALTLGVGFAGEPSQQPSERDSRGNHAAGVAPAGPAHGKQTPGKAEPADGKPSIPKDDSHVSVKTSPASPTGAQPKSIPAIKPPQPALNTAAPAAKAGVTTGGLMMNKTGNQPPAKLPVGSRTGVPRPGTVYGRSGIPAAIGGTTTASAKKPATALDGASFKLKP